LTDCLIFDSRRARKLGSPARASRRYADPTPAPSYFRRAVKLWLFDADSTSEPAPGKKQLSPLRTDTDPSGE